MASGSHQQRDHQADTRAGGPATSGPTYKSALRRAHTSLAVNMGHGRIQEAYPRRSKDYDYGSGEGIGGYDLLHYDGDGRGPGFQRNLNNDTGGLGPGGNHDDVIDDSRRLGALGSLQVGSSSGLSGMDSRSFSPEDKEVEKAARCYSNGYRAGTESHFRARVYREISIEPIVSRAYSGWIGNSEYSENGIRRETKNPLATAYGTEINAGASVDRMEAACSSETKNTPATAYDSTNYEVGRITNEITQWVVSYNTISTSTTGGRKSVR